MPTLDETVHQRTRLGILTMLAEVGSASFTHLRDTLGLSDGNLSRHLRVLEEASDQRRAELRAQLDDLPAALSRRALVSAAVTDLRAAPDKGAIVSRALRKVGRIPGAAWRRGRARIAR